VSLSLGYKALISFTDVDKTNHLAAVLQTSEKVHWRGFISTTPETWKSQKEDTSLSTSQKLILYDKLWEFISEVHLIISAAIFDYNIGN
jgi:hypothetical protein